jgi:hypothetical protein
MDEDFVVEFGPPRDVLEEPKPPTSNTLEGVR